MSKIPNQKTLPTVWDLSPLIPGDGSEIAFDADLARSKATASDFAARWRERDDYLTQSKILAQALEEYEKLERDSSEEFFGGHEQRQLKKYISELTIK